MLVFHVYFKIILNTYYVSFILGLSIYYIVVLFTGYDQNIRQTQIKCYEDNFQNISKFKELCNCKDNWWHHILIIMIM